MLEFGICRALFLIHDVSYTAGKFLLRLRTHANRVMHVQKSRTPIQQRGIEKDVLEVVDTTALQQSSVTSRMRIALTYLRNKWRRYPNPANPNLILVPNAI